MVKITDVARAAGVSPSTVSHVLSGNRPISDATKQHVLSVVRKLGYTPNPNAQAMKSARTGIIGFFAADITEIFVNEIVRGVESVMVPRGNHLLLVSGAEFDNDPKAAIEFLASRRIDGAIISYGISTEKPDPDFRKPTFPVVSINRDVSDDIPCILPDNYLAGRDVARHLFERGVLQAAIIGGPRGRSASDHRIKGFLDAASDLGISVDNRQVRHAPFSFAGGQEEMCVLLEQGMSFDGLFCANDYIACGAMTVAAEHGRRVPDELKVIGFDDREFSAFWPTPVSTVSQPLFRMGQLSARYLSEFIEQNEEVPRLTALPGELIARKSTDPV